MSVGWLLDNSAWARLGLPSVPTARLDEIADAIELQHVAACLPFLLEAGYSARGANDHDRLMRELTALPFLAIDDAVEHRAIDAQRQLARAGHHRLPPVYLIIAALADRHGVGVLHYDQDYEILAAKTDLEFESVWLAARGTL